MVFLSTRGNMFSDYLDRLTVGRKSNDNSSGFVVAQPHSNSDSTQGAGLETGFITSSLFPSVHL